MENGAGKGRRNVFEQINRDNLREETNINASHVSVPTRLIIGGGTATNLTESRNQFPIIRTLIYAEFKTNWPGAGGCHRNI